MDRGAVAATHGAAPGILEALDEHTWTGGVPAPDEWVELLLWRELYRCDPVRLGEIVAEFGVQKVLTDLAMWSIAQENARLKAEQRYGR